MKQNVSKSVLIGSKRGIRNRNHLGIIGRTERGREFLKDVGERLSLTLTDLLNSPVTVRFSELSAHRSNSQWQLEIGLTGEEFFLKIRFTEDLVTALGKRELAKSQNGSKLLDPSREGVVLGTAYFLLGVLEAETKFKNFRLQMSSVEIRMAGKMEGAEVFEIPFQFRWEGIEYSLSVLLDEPSERFLLDKLPYRFPSVEKRKVDRLSRPKIRLVLGWRCSSLLETLQLSPGDRIPFTNVRYLECAGSSGRESREVFRCEVMPVVNPGEIPTHESVNGISPVAVRISVKSREVSLCRHEAQRIERK